MAEEVPKPTPDDWDGQGWAAWILLGKALEHLRDKGLLDREDIRAFTDEALAAAERVDAHLPDGVTRRGRHVLAQMQRTLLK